MDIKEAVKIIKHNMEDEYDTIFCLALQTLIDFASKVPKKKELSGRYGDPSFQQQQDIGYNQCVADFHKDGVK